MPKRNGRFRYVISAIGGDFTQYQVTRLSALVVIDQLSNVQRFIRSLLLEVGRWNLLLIKMIKIPSQTRLYRLKSAERRSS